MATGPRSKAASSCNEDRSWSVREALLTGLICLFLASLTLLHNCREQAEEPSMQPTSKVARGESDVPDAASSVLANGVRIPAQTFLEPAIESVNTDLSLELLRLAVTDSNATIRLRAVAALADIDDEQAGTMLAAALQDQDAAVRQEAIVALSERHGAADVQALEQALTDPDSRVRESAIEALVTIGGEQSARALSVLVHVGDVTSRLQAVDALGAIGGDIAMASLHDALTDENDAVREAASELLGETRR